MLNETISLSACAKLPVTDFILLIGINVTLKRQLNTINSLFHTVSDMANYN